MKTFITEFRENIPYIAEEIKSLLLQNIKISEETPNVLHIIEEGLIDWISDYQSEQNTMRDVIDESEEQEFYNNQL